MRKVVSGRVAHLPLTLVLFYMFALPLDAPLQVVALYEVHSAQRHSLNICIKIVACMLHVAAHGYILFAVHVVYPILSHNVEGLLFAGAEGRCYQRHLVVLVGRVVERRRAECGAEKVVLPSSEIYFELLYVLHCAEGCCAVAGGEIVSVARNISYEASVQVRRYSPVEKCLIIKEVRVVLSLCVQRAQKITVGLVAQ